MSDEELPEIARKIRDAIEKTGETQAEIARRAGINRDMMNRYVRGITKPPLPKITAIAQALGIDPRELDDRAQPASDTAPEPLRFMITYELSSEDKIIVKLEAGVRSLNEASDLADKLKNLIVRHRR
jgi:transcriptional regulator with XRE-family HTH domain